MRLQNSTSVELYRKPDSGVKHADWVWPARVVASRAGAGYNDAMTWGMVGHEWAVDLLREHVRRDQVRHAYLLTGSDGLGKRTLAVRFAQVLCCSQPPEPGERCGTCRSCRMIAQGEYPDLHLVEAETTGGQLKVEQVRELSRLLSLAPYEGRMRVALLLRFHEANDSAANALLKTLEEPSPQVVLILTARSQQALLPTIVSRCEVIPLRQVKQDQVERALQDRGATPGQAELIASLADGRPGWAISHVDDRALLERRTQLLDEMMELTAEGRAGRFAYVESMLKKKDTEAQRQVALQALEQWAALWRDAMLRSYSADRVRLRNIDRTAYVDALVGAIDAPTLAAVVQNAEETRAAIERNVNVRLALENWLLDVPEIRK